MAILINIISMAIVIIILMAVIYVIHSVNRKLKEKIEIERKKLLLIHENFEKISKTNPKEKELDTLDQIARDMFNERDSMNLNISYVELSKLYKKEDQALKSKFCDKMSELIYSKKTPKTEDIKEVINIFSEILNGIKIPKA